MHAKIINFSENEKRDKVTDWRATNNIKNDSRTRTQRAERNKTVHFYIKIHFLCSARLASNATLTRLSFTAVAIYQHKIQWNKIAQKLNDNKTSDFYSLETHSSPSKREWMKLRREKWIALLSCRLKWKRYRFITRQRGKQILSSDRRWHFVVWHIQRNRAAS